MKMNARDELIFDSAEPGKGFTFHIINKSGKCETYEYPPEALPVIVRTLEKNTPKPPPKKHWWSR